MNSAAWPAGVFLVKVQAHHSTSRPTALVEGGRADWLQSVHKCQQGVAQSYLADKLYHARRRLNSASLSLPIVCCTWLSTVGDRAFPVATPHIWNSLPQHVMSALSLAIFCSRLKTHLFRRCFSWLHCSLVVPEKWHVITDMLLVIVFVTVTIRGLCEEMVFLTVHDWWIHYYTSYLTHDSGLKERLVSRYNVSMTQQRHRQFGGNSLQHAVWHCGRPHRIVVCNGKQRLKHFVSRSVCIGRPSQVVALQKLKRKNVRTHYHYTLSLQLLYFAPLEL